jgi:hypothetical protein
MTIEVTISINNSILSVFSRVITSEIDVMEMMMSRKKQTESKTKNLTKSLSFEVDFWKRMTDLSEADPLRLSICLEMHELMFNNIVMTVS